MPYTVSRCLPLVSRCLPLVLLILDGLLTITCRWPDTLVQKCYQQIRRRLAVAGSPIPYSKSSAPEDVTQTEIPFIRHTIDLEGNVIRQSPTKWAKIATAERYMRVGQSYCYERWRSTTGRLSWYVAMSRGLFAVFAYVYHDTHAVERQLQRSPRPTTKVSLRMTLRRISELTYIISTARFTLFCAKDSIWSTIVALDASVTAGVFKYAEANVAAVNCLWKIAVQRQVSGDTVPKRY